MGLDDAGRALLHWDVFCRVIDNHGDLGVCWRLASRLAALGQTVRLWVDDAAALAWMAPGGACGVAVLPWREPQDHEDPGDVVVEAFGCDPPARFVARMAARAQPPLWINLEYLSAEPYAERSHGLPSPQSAGPGAGLTKWFFYPGFGPRGGGLLLEDALAAAPEPADAEAWLRSIDVEPLAGARRISLFCYRQLALADALAAWRQVPTQLLVSPGPAAQQVAALLDDGSGSSQAGSTLQRDALHVHFLPWLAQPDYDRLLRACDLNHVRGEDSLVRAIWAARPFLWQLYVQDDDAHHAKLEAFLQRYLDGAPAALGSALGAAFRRWNGSGSGAWPAVDAAAWAAHAEAWSAGQRAQQRSHGDLARRLLSFVAGKR